MITVMVMRHAVRGLITTVATDSHKDHGVKSR